MDHPLLLKACRSGRFGHILSRGGSSVYETGFLYLDGEPDLPLAQNLKNLYGDRMIICLNSRWETVLLERYPALYRTMRCRMTYEAEKMDRQALLILTKAIPQEYQLDSFGERAFNLHPFHHGRNYPSFEVFQKEGAGAVVWRDGEIVASASSFLSFGGAVELDISTCPAHRRKGLAAACAASMLLNCLDRGIQAHWDAQNIASRKLAEKLGYTLSDTYTAYSFIKPNEP